ncbi:class I SAM-dependent methyltransferase [uncultured Helicobacter sp.]|uniref:class I SAM-dependent methyltransferase n=1 Tax=uncultured Helicobacter sp. TaxID=175537 RepID=UPI0026133287|nr:class I SAM-dependent methyltransferase [uncultured Helicobacter sp.]
MCFYGGGGGSTHFDYGCGFGRAIPYFEQYKCIYYGCDIAQSCIDYISNNYPHINVKKLLKDDKIPFSSDSFDAVFCYGVFDACFQHIALEEVLRVLKIGGVALITGKNNHYLDTDTMAKETKIGARKNGHPNFFTDTKTLFNLLSSRNINILHSRFFLERKDNATDSYLTDMPDKFYTYAILIQKTQKSLLKPFQNFSVSKSQNFKIKEKK